MSTRRVGDFLRREAQRDLEAASRRAAEQLGVSIKRISVRDQSSRWGSCSTTGVLSYSWRLILAPPFVLDYLAVHEVAHLVEMNHSPRFWRLVNRHLPGRRARQGMARRARHRPAPLRPARRKPRRATDRLTAHCQPLKSGASMRGTRAKVGLNAASRHLRPHAAARLADRLGPLSVDMYLASLPESAGCSVRRRRRCSSPSRSICSALRSRRCSTARCPTGMAASRCCSRRSASICWRRSPARSRLHRDADRGALRAGGGRIGRDRAGARDRARSV